MDYRIPLKFNTILAFGNGMSCHIEETIGQGSNAIVYKGWYVDNLNPDLRHHVLIKELFPFHPQQKIRRDETGCIVIAPEAIDAWNTHWKSFEIGNQVHLRLLEEHPDLMVMGANLNSFFYHNTLYSVLGYTGGRTLLSELNHTPLPSQHKEMEQSSRWTDTSSLLRHMVYRMIQLLNALEAFHKSNYLHLDISPDNIMLVGQKEQEHLFLIDYNSARQVLSSNEDYLSCKEGYSAPEVSTGNFSKINFASDLYSVTAVFYRCLMGRNLTLAEALLPKAPTGQDSPLLTDAPQTVRNLISRILRKGLHTLSSKRYQSISQMREVFQELMERIDGIGVTHWSLWENGKRSVEELICMNPSLHYLKNEQNLYPIRLEKEYSISLSQYLQEILSPNGHSGILFAQGGMGKTTLLLHSAMTQTKQYSSSAPAIFYISLNGWNQADTQYIRTQILMRLHFKKEENTFETALSALQQILQQPLKSKTGTLPSILLLLDGLNEIQDDMGPLLQEINELQAMAGVRILAASRSEISALHLEPAKLTPLYIEDIENTLGKHGLLIPKNTDILQLLRTPLILSIYIQASEVGKQLEIQNKKELMKAYLHALLQKELQQLPEDSPQRWQIEAALYAILPMIAIESQKSNYTFTNIQFLQLTEKMWKLFHSSMMKKIFPQWIGHSRDILGETLSADEWYGIIIHNILWKKLGILIKDSNQNYRIFHQEIEEYLIDEAAIIYQRIRKYHIARGITLSVTLLPILLIFTYFILPYVRIETAVPYNESKTEIVIENVSVCYNIYGSRLKQMLDLTSQLSSDNTETFLDSYEYYESLITQTSLLDKKGDDYQIQIDELCQSGEQVAWSKLPFDEKSAKLLIVNASEYLDKYTAYLPLLKSWAQSSRAQTFCPNFPEAFQSLLTADARLMSKLYYQSCYPHLEKGNTPSDETWETSIKNILVSIPEYDTEPSQNLESLQNSQKKSAEEFSSLAAIVKQVCETENN